MTLHPKSQGSKYRVFRALMFVATGLCGVAPLVHGIKVFGMSQMMRKAFPYTMAKAGCLLSGTAFYAVSLPFVHKREMDLTDVNQDQISGKSISWQIRSMRLSFDLSRPGGMCRCGSVDGVSGCLRLCWRKSYLLVSLREYACWVLKFWPLRSSSKSWSDDRGKKHMMRLPWSMDDACYDCLYPTNQWVEGIGTYSYFRCLKCFRFRKCFRFLKCLRFETVGESFLGSSCLAFRNATHPWVKTASAFLVDFTRQIVQFCMENMHLSEDMNDT